MTMTFGSLFAGIGGFDLRLERAGMKCKWQVEIDEYASRILAKHWPNVERWADVRTFPPGGPSEWSVDLVCAGVPCQPVSVAGKQKGKDDERWMWGECLRVVANLLPRFFVAENPASLLTHDRGRTFGGITGALESVGYSCEWGVASAYGVGAPHKRERVFVIARRQWEPVFFAEDFGWCECCGDRWCPRCNKHAGGCSCATPGKSDDFELVDCVWGTVAYPNGQRTQVQPRRILAEVKMPERACYWETEPEVDRMAYGVPSRMDRLRCLGNAVVPQIVEIIGRAIIKANNRRHA